jgi:hypothetical protein
MSDWNFEASADGNDWEVLHRARNDAHIQRPSVAAREDLRELIEHKEEAFEKAKATPEETRAMKIDTCTGFAEERLRHTWDIDGPPSSFYRFFRILGPGEEEIVGRNGSIGLNGCLHGVGFELFGDVQALQEE